MTRLKVASKSNPNKVAGAIAGVIKDEGKVEIVSIGAGALNQAVKAIAISRGFTAPCGIDLVCKIGFIDLEIDGNEKTGIIIIVDGIK